jgi:hypothetical protein
MAGSEVVFAGGEAIASASSSNMSGPPFLARGNLRFLVLKL